MKKIYYNKICEILTPKQKDDAKLLLKKIESKELNNLINIWEKSSCLLRWNNIKKEIQKSNIESSENLNILIIGLQYFVDQKTHKSLYLPQTLLEI